MRGIDLSDEDLRLARVFLGEISKQDWTDEHRRASITRGELVRLVAWYGHIRAHGDNSGCLVVNGKPVEKRA